MTVICCGFWTKKFQNLKKCDRKVTKNQSMKIDENTNTAKILLTIRIQPKSIQITGKPESLNLLKLEKAENRNLNAFFIKIDFFFLSANCIVMALDEHLPNGDKTVLALQLVSFLMDLFLFMCKSRPLDLDQLYVCQCILRCILKKKVLD